MARVQVRIPLVQFESWRCLFPTWSWVNGSLRPIIPLKTHKDGVLPNAVLTPAELASLSVAVETESEYLNAGRTDVDREAVKRAWGDNPDGARVTSDTLRKLPKPADFPV